ncbi:protein Shroom3 [Myripristis murdjan]|uniref:protein Shroom3 n=1 Tax=Myripristis murdjan TaxID=586833 RepID=UPI00117636BE|nr:protein Shroom3-like [Myripristis murdjan]
MAALRRDREALAEEERRHSALCCHLEELVQEHCRANEADKYRSFIGDLERIVNLLLSLCGRLSRIDRALLALHSDSQSEEAADERASLQVKRSQLLAQTEDARELKENLERRQRVVHAVLSGRLAAPQLHDYRRFVAAKPSLLIRRRHLDDLIRQGEERLARLTESLPPPEATPGAGGRAGAGPLPASSAPCPCPFPSLLSSGHAHAVHSTAVTSL